MMQPYSENIILNLYNNCKQPLETTKSTIIKQEMYTV